MDKDISRFARELADYINSHIVGTENTYIMKCIASDMVLNRGHAIPLEVVMPAGVSAKCRTMGPCFYAEELMEEFPGHTPAAIAEAVNMKVCEQYQKMVEIMGKFAAAEHKGMDDYERDRIVVTAMRSFQVPDESRKGCVTKDLPELGLTLTMKAQDGEYLIPIYAKEGVEAVDKDWDDADANTVRGTGIRLAGLMAPDGQDRDVAVCGHIIDANAFYDFFYLLSPKHVWAAVIKDLGAEKLYIIPENPYYARFVLDSPAVRESSTAKQLRNAFTKDAVKDAGGFMPIFVMDCGTLEITRLKTGGIGNEDK